MAVKITYATKPPPSLDSGVLHFTVESRLLRELGERLVKQPEVALLELVKNSYDADATRCDIAFETAGKGKLSVDDDGRGMTLDQFKQGWMRVGTSAKEALALSDRFMRVITGEKGIGRFAVRFLGRHLKLVSVAEDPKLGFKTKLTADFDWLSFDKNEDLGKIDVPFALTRATEEDSLGTSLTISGLRDGVGKTDVYAVRAGSIGVVTPHLSLLKPRGTSTNPRAAGADQDPGFRLTIRSDSPEHDGGDGEENDQESIDVARGVLDRYVLRVTLSLTGDRLHLKVYRRDVSEPVLDIKDRYPNSIGYLHADIRTFPQRKGTFTDMTVDGRVAKTWVKRNSGIAVYDRNFRVHPFGTPKDDWLGIAADVAKRLRFPRSSIAKKHFPMDEATKQSTQLNYMLKLPYSEQMVGVVQIEGQRATTRSDSTTGLIASADREGFLKNETFDQLQDIVRGAVEAIAFQDRELTMELDRLEQDELLEGIKKQTEDAVREIEGNPNIARQEKARIIKSIIQTQTLAEQYQALSAERQASLEVMSLLGVVAGFMTHEFGVAIDDLQKAQEKLRKAGKKDPEFAAAADYIGQRIANLNEFVNYSQGYIKGASAPSGKTYPARPRIQQVLRIGGEPGYRQK